MLRHQFTFLILTSPLFLLSAACGGSGQPSSTTTTGTGGSGGGGTGGGNDTGGGDTGGGGSTPEPEAGIPGCASAFVEDDGVCRPRLAKCPAGQIPSFAEGCKPVGVVGCAAAFLGADGICRPSMAACPEGSYAVPTKGCVPIDGDGCGNGTWGAIPDDAANLYVDAAYAGVGSDGTKSKPWKTIAAALAAAAKGARVVLAAGTYDEPLEIKKGIEVVGRCPSMVKITGTAPFFDLTAIVAIKDVADPVTVRRVQVGGTGVGLRVSNAKVTFDEVWVKGATSSGLGISSAAVVTLERSLVEGTLPAQDGKYGDGVEVVQGASLTVEDSAFARNHLWDLSAFHSGTTLLVKNTLSEAPTEQVSDGYASNGIYIGAGAEATIENTVVVAAQTAGLQAAQANTLVKVYDSVFLDSFDKTLGSGILVHLGAELELTASALIHNSNSGLSLFEGSTVTAQGNLIALSGGVPTNEADGYFLSGGHLISKDDVLYGNEGAGIAALHKDARVEATSCLLESNRARGDGRTGYGAGLEDGAKLVLDRAAIIDNLVAGVFVPEKCEATVSNSLIEKTAVDAATKTNGVGVFASGGTVTVTGTLLRDNLGAGIALFESTAKIANVVIRRVASGTVAMSGDASAAASGIGDGLLALGGSTVTLEGSLLTECARAGILFDASTGTVQQTRSTANKFGVVSQKTEGLALGEGNQISGNTEQDVVSKGELPVP